MITSRISRVLTILALLGTVPAELCLAVLRIGFKGRAHPKWTIGQNATIESIKAILHVVSTLRIVPKLTLSAGFEKERFVSVLPAPASTYKGPTDDKEIRPVAIGGTWTPRVPDTRRSAEGTSSLLVLLHFHGGAYVVGDGRDGDTGFLINTLLEHGGYTHVFTPSTDLLATLAVDFLRLFRMLYRRIYICFTT
ncbi:unnamed protein product [Parascedosporium putredinis]|uniref:Alpha/beta hydrolase fold-3 domain-containing protein n=1 Tax=Parascedosporium putredinis TaxID=1442378 RepID=A0A9P1GZP2_9PEZI|nr:unnamed protein product [Parascedosporium putredinis]CAI7991003.1 unnamed protein product [Parascedosporium putredinis]